MANLVLCPACHGAMYFEILKGKVTRYEKCRRCNGRGLVEANLVKHEVLEKLKR
jgi:hypothetical protein